MKIDLKKLQSGTGLQKLFVFVTAVNDLIKMNVWDFYVKEALKMSILAIRNVLMKMRK